MTANPDSALRQALAALTPFAKIATTLGDDWNEYEFVAVTIGGLTTHTQMHDLRRAREAHALITEALAQSQDKP